ncbi:MAG: ribosome recycling factor [Elusimicrobia bacterium]|nr:ribosome recycling factor [Elusimicrobiota bacterium]
MSAPAHFQKFHQEAQKAMEHMKKEFVAIRTSRASPALLDRVRVEAYGGEMPVNQVASVSVVEGRTLEVRPWDPQVVPSIEKAIQKADLGIAPNTDGAVIRLVFPALTEERRKEYVKVAKQLAEETRVKVRKARHQAQEEAVQGPFKDKKIPEDEKFRRQTSLDQLTAKFIADIDSLLASKEKEILEI